MYLRDTCQKHRLRTVIIQRVDGETLALVSSLALSEIPAGSGDKMSYLY